MSFFEVRFPEFEFDSCEFALQYSDKKIPTSARGLQKAGVDSFGLSLYEAEHRFNEPCRCEYLAMVGDPLF